MALVAFVIAGIFSHAGAQARNYMHAGGQIDPSRSAPIGYQGASFTGSGEEGRFAIVDGDFIRISGSPTDLRHVQQIAQKLQTPFVWFVQDGVSYVIRDRATVAASTALFSEIDEFARRQMEMHRRQDELRGRQAELAREQTNVSIRLPDFTDRLERIRQEMKSAASQDDLTRLQRELGSIISEISREQARVSEVQSRIGLQQGEVGKMQGALGLEQADLGMKQATAAKLANQKAVHLLQDSLSRHLGNPDEDER